MNSFHRKGQSLPIGRQCHSNNKNGGSKAVNKPRTKYYKIGEVADMFGVHEDTLRNWDERGLIVADRVGTRKDRRYKASHIRDVKEKGLVSDLVKKRPMNNAYENYTHEQLIKEITILKRQKKYGLVYEEKTEEAVGRCQKEAPILENITDRRISDKDPAKPQHILIEGDNYHALQILNWTHKGKIDVIYIDPPYNTGNKDFIYNDKYVDKEDNYRHSKWLSFMERRLRLAKNLLSDKGVIFISIDDNEQARLRLLCDEIFGEENIEVMVWRKSGDGRYGKMKNTKTFRNDHEYVLVGYKKLKNLNKIRTYPDFKTKPRKEGERYFWVGYIARGKKGNNKEHKNYYSVTSPTGKIFEAQFEVSKEEFLALEKKGKILWTESGTPYRKIYKDEYREIICPSVLLDAGSTYQGKIDICNAFGIKDTINTPFDNPKPIDLIKRLLNLSTSGDEVILDFMAGSGTTGQAVIEFNKEYGGNRQFILCTNNEDNNGNGNGGIAEGICYPRIKKVIEGYREHGKGKEVAGLGGSLEYLKIAFVEVEDIHDVLDEKKLKFAHRAGPIIALKENTFTELEKNKWYQIFTDGKDKFVGIYFKENLEKLMELEKKLLHKKEVKLYLFSCEGGDVWESDYAEHENVTVESIPVSILQVYKRLNS